MLFERKEMEVLRRTLHQVAEFSGVEILTYAIMSNHFHVLVRVSNRAKKISDMELIRRYKILYPKPTKYRAEDASIIQNILKMDGEDAKKLRSQLTARMGNISEFIRSLKQRFSIWFNKTHNRYGPLWSDRFKSVVVENDPTVVRTIAAYIDLNPIRAGLVSDPKDYRFCGYSEALAGNSRMQLGIQAILALKDTQTALADYRMVLFGKGARPKNDGSGQRLNDKATREVMAQHGTLPNYTHLHQRISYFTQGAVIGSQLFVDSCIQQWSSKIGDLRPRSPHRINIEDAGNLTSFRRSRA